MSYVDAIVQKFGGGPRPMSRKTGIPPSTIQSWLDAGVIPARRQPEILRLAREQSIELSPMDFFEQGVAA